MKTFSTKPEDCAPFGFRPGQRVMTTRGPAWVIGVNGGELYWHIDGEIGASKWTHHREADFLRRRFYTVFSPFPGPPTNTSNQMVFTDFVNEPRFADVVFHVLYTLSGDSNPLDPLLSPQSFNCSSHCDHRRFSSSNNVTPVHNSTSRDYSSSSSSASTASFSSVPFQSPISLQTPLTHPPNPTYCSSGPRLRSSDIATSLSSPHCLNISQLSPLPTALFPRPQTNSCIRSPDTSTATTLITPSTTCSTPVSHQHPNATSNDFQVHLHPIHPLASSSSSSSSTATTSSSSNHPTCVSIMNSDTDSSDSGSHPNTTSTTSAADTTTGINNNNTMTTPSFPLHKAMGPPGLPPLGPRLCVKRKHPIDKEAIVIQAMSDLTPPDPPRHPIRQQHHQQHGSAVEGLTTPISDSQGICTPKNQSRIQCISSPEDANSSSFQPRQDEHRQTVVVQEGECCNTGEVVAMLRQNDSSLGTEGAMGRGKGGRRKMETDGNSGNDYEDKEGTEREDVYRHREDSWFAEEEDDGDIFEEGFIPSYQETPQPNYAHTPHIFSSANTSSSFPLSTSRLSPSRDSSFSSPFMNEPRVRPGQRAKIYAHKVILCSRSDVSPILSNSFRFSVF